jgi:hypothetical protein
MRRLLTTAALAALTLPVLALGGDGFRCENECPLAAMANAHRVYGTEAVAASAVAQAELYREVERNLARI